MASLFLEKQSVRYSKYSTQEDKIILDNWQSKSDLHISNLIGRSESSVMNRRVRLNKLRNNKKTFQCYLDWANAEVKRMRKLFTDVQDMKALIIVCQLETNQYKRDRYKSELRKLSGIKW